MRQCLFGRWRGHHGPNRARYVSNNPQENPMKAPTPKVYFRVSTKGGVRFETLFLEQAEEFARGIYRATKQIADIDEVQR